MASPAELSLRQDRSVRKGLVKKRKRRLLRRLRDLARLCMAGILAYGIYWLWGSPVWHWHGQVQITGNRLVSKQEILARLQVPENTPLYKLNPGWIESQVRTIPTISRVAVRRWLFPPRLEMTVLERQALVAVVGESPNRWMDQEGVVFTASAKVMKPQFPVQLWTSLRPGERLGEAEQALLFELLSTWPKGHVGRIDMRKPQDVYAQLDGWPVRLGEIREIPAKFGMLRELTPLAQKYQDRLQYIDLRYPASPAFKLKTGAQIDVPKPQGKPASPAPSPSASPAASPRPSPSKAPPP